MISDKERIRRLQRNIALTRQTLYGTHAVIAAVNELDVTALDDVAYDFVLEESARLMALKRDYDHSIRVWEAEIRTLKIDPRFR